MPQFVQFPHPGAEHRQLAVGGVRPWHTAKRGHKRSFVQVEAQYLDHDADLKKGPVWAWSEWEAQACAIRHLERPLTPGNVVQDKRYPRTLWEPHLTPLGNNRPAYQDFHNTDPLIFGGFWYTDCRQGSNRRLRELGSGSVIAFGSKLSHEWVLDTVFVVEQGFDHNFENYLDVAALAGVPHGYDHLTLHPTYSAQNVGRRLYRGQIFDRNLRGPFSFFPCIPMTAELTQGFRRPAVPDHLRINGHSAINQNLSRAARIIDSDPGQIEQVWQALRDAVLQQGLCLGVSSEFPQFVIE